MRHDIREIRKEFEEVCEMLAPTDFVGFLNRVGNDYTEFHKWKDRYWEQLHNGNVEGIEFGAGCTRLVVIPPYGNYVFKIQYDEAELVDYCRNECFVYSKAVERGCEKYFAWIGCLGEYGSVLVYAMEKVEVNEDRNSEDSYVYHCKRWEEEREEREDEGDDEYYGDYDDHEGMIEYAIGHNGGRMEEAAALIWDLGVNDLHSANWGYRGDVLVVVDYGGYGSDAFEIANMAKSTNRKED